jgi:hypothetical protein
MGIVLKVLALIVIFFVGYKVNSWYTRELYKAKTGRELRDMHRHREKKKK